jgi:hypothetical protein
MLEAFLKRWSQELVTGEPIELQLFLVLEVHRLVVRPSKQLKDRLRRL